jgi:thioredoxin 1
MIANRKMLGGAFLACLLVGAGCGDGRASAGAPSPSATASTPPSAAGPARASLPRLVDLGANKCIPCKAMAPILDGLRTEYAGRLEVQFVDVWKDPDAAEPYRVRVIPTQIFYGADGRELGRHEGFIDRAQILERWKALGVAL